MDELEKIYNILVSFLGESKSGFDPKNMQYQFACPRCVENKGEREILKKNLEVNLSLQVYRCWSCVDEGEEMHGSIIKLIRKYGNEKILQDYKDAVKSFRESKLYKTQFDDNEFNINTAILDADELRMPKSFHPLRKDSYVPKDVEDYLKSRGIGWDIIEKYNIGYTREDKDKYIASFRIYIPSYDSFGYLNYWTGRDYLNRDKVVKYFNPKVERKSIIFNENKIQWDADVTLVEGPFDHIVVPNSIPLLGKVLNKEFKLYWDIINKSNSKINIWLDGDAYNAVKKIYKELNHNNLYNKIRFIPTPINLDPSKIYELYGYKGIIQYLKTAKKISEIELQN